MYKNRRSLSDQYLKQLSREIDPDEIFLDAQNLPDFDKDQFEGRIERPITGFSVFGIFLSFVIVTVLLFAKVVDLQVIHGEEFFKKSENNRLDHTPIFAMRGVISDRTGTPLAWNVFDENTTVRALEKENTVATTTGEFTFARRAYVNTAGFGHILGYVAYPKKDTKGNYYQKELFGKDGVEEHYNELLSGKNGLQIVETDAHGHPQSGNIVVDAQNGEALTLGIDAHIQEKFYAAISETARGHNYTAGAGAIMDVTNGELLALVSYPEYESKVLADGSDKKTIQGYLTDKRSVFLDRTVSGLYTPGSIVKPIMAVAALNEGVIVPEKQILSTGSISIQNPYDPTLKTVFNDWKVHGWVDMRHAIAVSSDVYFYEIGGGYEDQNGIGIANIEKYAQMFGFGSPTGVDLGDEKKGTIPSPAWKAKIFNGEQWRLGDTYHTVIGQYGFQVTLLQAVRAIAAIANGGELLTPHLLREPAQEFAVSTINIPDEYFKVVREGMREAVNSGTVKGLDVDYVNVAGKTGTAELDTKKKFINSWVVGFFPYEKPRYAFAIIMEHGPYANDIGGVYVMRQLLDWMHVNTPEYLKLKE